MYKNASERPCQSIADWKSSQAGVRKSKRATGEKFDVSPVASGGRWN